MNSFPGKPSSLSKPNTWPPSSATRSVANSPRGSKAPASSIVSANPRSRSTTNSASSDAWRPPPTTSPLSSTTARACPREGGGGTLAGPGNPRPCPRQKDRLQPQGPARDPARLQSPLSRISLQSGRLLGRHPRARPSHPTPSRQWPQSQEPAPAKAGGLNFFSRAEQTLLSALQRPGFDIAGLRRADLLPLVARCSPATLSRQLARLRQLGVIKRVTGTYRYDLTRAGRAAIAAGRRLT